MVFENLFDIYGFDPLKTFEDALKKPYSGPNRCNVCWGSGEVEVEGSMAVCAMCRGTGKVKMVERKVTWSP